VAEPNRAMISVREGRDTLAAALVDHPDRTVCLRHMMSAEGIECRSLAELVLTGPVELLRIALAQGVPLRDSEAPTRTSEPYGVVPGTLRGGALLYGLPAVHCLVDNIIALHDAGAIFKPPRVGVAVHSPLTLAAMRCKVEPHPRCADVIAPLVEMVGVDPNIVDPRSGATALRVICDAEPSPWCTAFALELVRCGAEIDGQRAVLCMALQDNMQLFSAFRHLLTPAHLNEAGQATPLAVAVFRHNDALVDALLACGVDVNKCGSHGKAPLCYAASQLRPTMIKRLVDAGADPNVGAPNTPLLRVLAEIPPPVGNVYSRQVGCAAECIETLLKAGANPNVPGVLDTAIAKGGARLVTLFLKHGADPSPRGPCPNVLHDALDYNPNPAIVEALVLSGARSTRIDRTDDDDDEVHCFGPIHQFAQTLVYHIGLRGPCSPRDNPSGYSAAIATIGAMLVAAGDDANEPLCTRHDAGVLSHEMIVQHDGALVPNTPYNFVRIGSNSRVIADIFGKLATQVPWCTIAADAPHGVAAHYLRTTRVPPKDIRDAACAEEASEIAQLAARPWSPSRHRYFHADVRSVAVQLMLVARRARSAPACPLHAVMARVPREMWFAILAHLPR
jgi:hypothetical protein